MPIVLETLNLATAVRQLCAEALNAGGSIVEAANLLGITRHALKRRIIKHRIQWPTHPQLSPPMAATPAANVSQTLAAFSASQP
jgi:transposase-like protein